MKEYADFRSFVLDVMNDENVGVREFARRLGVSHPTVSDVLAGGKPSLKTCRAIAKHRHMHYTRLRYRCEGAKRPSAQKSDDRKIAYHLTFLFGGIIPCVTDYTLITPVGNAIALFAAVVSVSLLVAFVAVGLARIAVDFFKG